MSVNYDFIIVGGGSSGATLASILSTKGPTLLIERGANHTLYAQSTVRHGWPQISALALEGVQNKGSGHWTGTANILGGGSAINGGACWRGERSIFESLGLGLDVVDQAFKYIEDRLCEPASDSQLNQVVRHYWEQTGMQPINSTAGYASWTNERNKVDNVATIQRARTLLPTSKSGQYRKPASYLFEHKYPEMKSRILDQGNLTVYLLTKAKRVLFNDNKESIGIEVSSPSGDFSVYVRSGGKVFLNAGAYETPKLLMLSGIGPAQTLSKFNIPLIHANDNVGKNLIDRKEFSVVLPMLDSFEGDDDAILDFAAIKPDYWSSFIHKHSVDWSNAFQRCTLCAPVNRTLRCFENIMGELLFYGINRRADPPHALPVYVAQRRPLTRGTVSLSSSNFNDAPLVHDGWNKEYENLSHDAKHDLEIMVDAVQDLIVNTIKKTGLMEGLGHPSSNYTGKFTQKTSSAISEILAQISGATQELERCSLSGFLNTACSSWDDCVPTIPPLPNHRKDLRGIVLEFLSSSHHISGTCKAGDVVERETLAVKGVSGLYISDLSVVTKAVDIHPMMTAMSIGAVVGNTIEGVPKNDYEVFPVVIAMQCLIIVFALVIWGIANWLYRRSSTSLLNTNYEFWSLNEFEIDTDTVPSCIAQANNSKALIFQDEKDSVQCNGNDMEVNFPCTDYNIHHSIMMWSKISCSYEKGKTKQHVTTLSNSIGSLKEGELTAIMGPSGAAKSTLLDILSGRKSIGNITGNISVLGNNFMITNDGQSEFTKMIQKNSAYIPQEESFYPTQLVKEAVAFAANMKLGRGDTRERTHLINSCLDAVGLDANVYASRKIGGDLAGGFNIRGLSGGERKRLTLACVLVLNPKIIFIDEITSGLDSENAINVIHLLKNLSVKQSVASMVIIHQPSPEIFAQFDKLILLSRGSCLFSGPCANISTFYKTNYKEDLPLNANIADDLIAKAAAFDITLTPKSSYNGESSDVFFDTSNQLSPNSNDVVVVPSKFWKLFVVFQRNFTNHYIRNLTNVAARLASYVLLSLLVGMLFWRVGDSGSSRGLTLEEAELVVRTNIFLANISYLLPFATIPVFFGDKKFLATERALKLYPPWMYAASQVFLEFAFVTLASILEALIVIPMCAISNPTSPLYVSFFTMLSTLITSGLVGSTIILCCSMALPTQDLAFLVSSTISTMSLALSGGFLPFSEMSVVPYSLQWLSPVKYTLQSIMIAQLKGTSAEVVLELAGYNTPATVSGNVSVLGGIFVFLSILTVIAMTRVKETR